MEKGHESVVQVLVTNGVNSGHTNFVRFDKGSTALHLASYLGFPEIVRLLLEVGEDIEAQDSKGLTPLLWVTRQPYKSWLDKQITDGLIGALNVLLAHGAKPDVSGEADLRGL